MVLKWIPVLATALPKTSESIRTRLFMEANLQGDNYRRHLNWESLDNKYLVTFFRLVELLEKEIYVDLEEDLYEDYHLHQDLYHTDKDCSSLHVDDVYEKSNDWNLYERTLCSSVERNIVWTCVSVKSLPRTDKYILNILDMSRKLEIDSMLTVYPVANKYEVTVVRGKEQNKW